ncbi:acetate--CoA ligase family protein [Micromonospora sp. NPDC005206]|uniref:acetate--CoA ligase family protein n=1 Tax=Micromonospora sp. NPDC005206 TaxID=3157022 RepID=UPI0033A85275
MTELSTSRAAVRRLDTTEAVDRLLHPRTVALVGASDDLEKFSGQPLRNLRAAGYSGAVHPVNRRGGTVGGMPAVTSVAELPDGIDTAMVMVPAAHCAAIVRELGEAGVPTAIVAVSGFAEVGTEEGRRLQKELAEAGREAGVRLVGPNCNGIYETREPLPLGYNYTHSQRLRPGSVALVAHSGAMLGGFVPALEAHGAGISAFVSCGNEVDLELTDYVEYFVDDPHTHVIALIVDGVHDGHRLRRAIAAARMAGKPVVALKLGNSWSGSQAAQAHSSRMAGSKAVYDAVFAADGVIAVPTLETLAVVSALLAHGRSLQKSALIATSTSGAGGVLLADVMGAHGLTLTQLAPDTVARMSDTAGFAQAMNPFDVGAAGASTISANLHALAADPGAGGLVFYLTPTPTSSWRQALARAVADVAVQHPALPVLMVSPAPLESDVASVYRDAGVPVVTSTLDAIVALEAVARVHVGAGGAEEAQEPAGPAAGRSAGVALSEAASRAYLRDRGVPVPAEVVVTGAEAAVAAAVAVGGPAVLKASGAGLTHKSEHGLVRLGLLDPDDVRAAFADLDRWGRDLDPDGYEGVLVAPMVAGGVEVVVGVTSDPDFGPIVLVGSGGVTAELRADVALSPVPLSREEAVALIERTEVCRLLHGYRGSERLDVDALADLVVAVARLSAESADGPDGIVAVDLNPVRVLPRGSGVAVLDALVVTREPNHGTESRS